MTGAFNEIAAQMQIYFDGLYHSDVSRLRKVFHPDARYVCPTDDPMVRLDMATYFGVVAEREAPAVRQETRADRIDTIRFAGPGMAFVVANCSIGDKHFTDFLSFVKTNREWRIISKVFHYDLIHQTKDSISTCLT